MANFVRYVGRAMPAISYFTNQLSDVAREIREGPIRAREAEQKQAINQQKFEEAKYDFEQKKKKDAELDSPVDSTMMWGEISKDWTEAEKKEALESARKMGFVDEKGITTKRKLNKLKEIAILQDDIRERIEEANRQGSLRRGQSLKKDFEKAVESGDQKKKDETMKAYDEWDKGHQAKIKGYDTLNKGVAAYKLYMQAEKEGWVTPQIKALAQYAMQTGDPTELMKALNDERDAVKKQGQGTTGRPFSVSGGIYDPETKEFKQPPWSKEGETGEEEKWTPFGYGQMRNTKTKEVVKVPVPPVKGGKTGTPTEGGVGQKEYSKADLVLINKTLAQLPKMKGEADAKYTAVQSADKALKMVEESGVTGKSGQFKAWINPWLESVGVKIKDYSEAQKFQLLSRVLVGPLRLEIVGTGPVSDYEQGLLAKVSGGGGAGKEAAKELLTHWKDRAMSTVRNYNEVVTGFTELYPDAGKVYKPVGSKETTQQEQANIMSEADARKALTTKGITGKAQDGWIDTYKKQGVVK